MAEAELAAEAEANGTSKMMCSQLHFRHLTEALGMISEDSGVTEKVALKVISFFDKVFFKMAKKSRLIYAETLHWILYLGSISSGPYVLCLIYKSW